MDWKNNYSRWISYPDLNTELKNQLVELDINDQVIEELFYKYLEFGTGGIRGELGQEPIVLTST
jgi:phosphoglucomutase